MSGGRYTVNDTLAMLKRLGDSLPEPWTPNARIDKRYEIIEPIGRGGFGSVFRAHDHLLGRDVALKRLHHEDDDDAFALRREIATLRILNLPNVVRFLDDVTCEDGTVLVMELVNGVPFPGAGTRADWESIRGPTLSLIETAGRLHDAGIVHRDLKPANVLVTDDDRAIILDFGISHVADVVSRFSRPDGTAGTPTYMAPEQFFGAADPRSDLYSIGAMLFECFTGRVPHHSDSREILKRRRTRERAEQLTALRPDLPEEVLEAVERMLETEPARRPSSAGEVLSILERKPYVDRVETLVADSPITLTSAMDWFVGPERLARRRSRAARELLRRSRADRVEVVRELRAWVRAGIARWHDDRLVVLDKDLVRLESGLALVPRTAARSITSQVSDETGLVGLLRLYGDPQSLTELRDKTGWSLDRLDMTLAKLFTRGHVELTGSARWRVTSDAPTPTLDALPKAQVQHPLERLLESLRTRPFPEVLLEFEEHLLSRSTLQPDVFDAATDALFSFCPADDLSSFERIIELIIVHQGVSHPHSTRALLSRIDRVPTSTGKVEYLRELVRVAELAFSQRDPGLEERLRRLGPHPSDRIERHRLMLIGYLRDAAGPRALGEFIDELAPLEHVDDERRELLHFLRARRAYASSRFDESVAQWQKAAETTRINSRRWTALSNRMFVLLDAGEFDAALDAAERLSREKSRDAEHLARVEMVRRSVAYRRGLPLAPDGQLLEAIFELGLGVASLILLELTLIWRAGQREELADGARRWKQSAVKPRALGVAALDALLYAVGETSTPRYAEEYVVSDARRDAPGLVAQILYLLALGGHAEAANFARDAVELINRLPTPDRSLRREFVSPNEIEELAAKLGCRVVSTSAKKSSH